MEVFSLERSIAIATGYIRACRTSEALQIDEKCAEIGGHIHAATVTPKEGFRWVAGFEPLQML